MVLSSGHKADIADDNSNSEFLKSALELLFIGDFCF